MSTSQFPSAPESEPRMPAGRTGLQTDGSGALVSAMAKLQDCAKWGPSSPCNRVTSDEAAALLAKLEAADRLAKAVSDYNPGDYSVQRALAGYRNTGSQP